MTVQSRITNENNQIKVFKIKVRYISVDYICKVTYAKTLKYRFKCKEHPTNKTIKESINKVVKYDVTNIMIEEIKQIKEN